MLSHETASTTKNTLFFLPTTLIFPALKFMFCFFTLHPSKLLLFNSPLEFSKTTINPPCAWSSKHLTTHTYI